jgi:hypothetical protein
MKIALAFFGQPRHLTDPIIIKEWERLIKQTQDRSDIEIDCYAHFWKTVSNVTINDDYRNFVKTETVDLNIDEFKKVTDMKKIEFGDTKELDELSTQTFGWNNLTKKRVDNEIPDTGRATLGQWLSTERVLRMVEETKIDYKYVIRIRPDLIFSPSYQSFYNIVLQKMMATNQCPIGTSDIRVIRGTPIAGDWFTVIEGYMISDFANNLSSDMAAHISSLFTEVEDPLSIQESAFYKFLIKRGYNTCSLKDTGLRIYRGKEDENSHNWKWPNFVV